MFIHDQRLSHPYGIVTSSLSSHHHYCILNMSTNSHNRDSHPVAIVMGMMKESDRVSLLSVTICTIVSSVAVKHCNTESVISTFIICEVYVNECTRQQDLHKLVSACHHLPLTRQRNTQTIHKSKSLNECMCNEE